MIKMNTWKNDMFIKAMLTVLLSIAGTLYSTMIGLVEDFNEFKGMAHNQISNVRNVQAEMKLNQKAIFKAVEDNKHELMKRASFELETRAEQVGRTKAVKFAEEIMNGGYDAVSKICNKNDPQHPCDVQKINK